MPGALISSFLFSVGESILATYLGNNSTSTIYGAAGSIVILLLWIYFTSIILFIGAEYIKAKDKKEIRHDVAET